MIVLVDPTFSLEREMTNRIFVKEHLTLDELEALAARAKLTAEWRRIQIVIRAMKGCSSGEIAEYTGYSKGGLFKILRDYNEFGVDAFKDKRAGRAGRPRTVPAEYEAILLHAVEHEEPPTGGLWTREKAQRWLEEVHNIEVSSSTAYRTMKRANLSMQTPRPANEKADKKAQESFKKKI